jgi:hypothetical protein
MFEQSPVIRPSADRHSRGEVGCLVAASTVDQQARRSAAAGRVDPPGGSTPGRRGRTLVVDASGETPCSCDWTSGWGRLRTRRRSHASPDAPLEYSRALPLEGGGG